MTVGAPQVPSRHLYSATTPLAIADGVDTVGGVYCIIDCIDVSVTSDATIARIASVKVIAGGGTIAQWDVVVNTAAAAHAQWFHLPFPAGFPVVSSIGAPLTTISITVTGANIVVAGIAADVHYRKWNG